MNRQMFLTNTVKRLQVQKGNKIKWGKGGGGGHRHTKNISVMIKSSKLSNGNFNVFYKINFRYNQKLIHKSSAYMQGDNIGFVKLQCF